MVDHVKSILKNWNSLPHIKTLWGDLGFTAALTFDFEVYSTAQKRWLEISSVSTFKAFSPSDCNCDTKIRMEKTSCSYPQRKLTSPPRVVAGLLENHQTQWNQNTKSIGSIYRF